MAAVGLQYTKNPIPALGLQSSGEDGSREFVSVFDESAWHLLESVIEINVLEAMKLCVALKLLFTSYMSCLTLVHSDSQMQLHGFLQSTWQTGLGHARSCLGVLEFCNKDDKVAENFAEVTKGYYSILAAQIKEIDYTSVYTPDNFDYLFYIPASPYPQLLQASRDLLKRISCPLDTPSRLHEKGVLRAGLGAHVTLMINCNPPTDPNSCSAVEIMLSDMPTGPFVGSPQPYGWDMFLNMEAM